jgi:hypothetical protein
MRWLAALLVLLLTATLALACGGEEQKANDLAAEPTEVIVVQPSALSVVEEVEGSCYTGSSKTVRPNAWRCSEDSRGYDPCFSESNDDDFVICAIDPETGVKMNLTEPLPVSYAHQEEDPSFAWILALADGSACTFVAGATGVVDGERANYSCSDEWWVVGVPEVDAVWTVHKVLMSEARDQAVDEADVAVTTVWR